MAQAKGLPARPNLVHLKKIAKRALVEAKKRDPRIKLAHVQLALAREYGFPSWKKLRVHVDSAASTASPEALIAAVRQGDVAQARKVLRADTALITARTEAGETLLHVAAERNDPPMIELLLKHGADASLKYGQSAHSALSWALTTQSFDAARALIRAGVQADLFCSAALGDVALVRTFFDDHGSVRPGASVTGSSRFGADGLRLPCPPTDPREVVSDALYIAARNGHAEVVRFLLTKDVDVNFKVFLGATPLHWAYFGASREVVHLLLDAGADASRRDSEMNCTPRAFGICVASSWGIERIVKSLLSQDPTLANVFDGRGTPLHEAARAGQAGVVELLLAAGARPDVRDAEGNTPSDLARKNNRPDVLKLLEPGLAKRSAVDEFLEASVVPRQGDHRRGNLDRANEILQAHPEIREDIFCACALGDRTALASLLKSDTTLATHAGGPRGWVPLLYLCFSRYMRLRPKQHREFTKCAKLLLDHGADANSYFLENPADESSPHETALYGAAGIANNPALAKLLLARGANPTETGMESLYHASEQKDNRCLEMILKAKPRSDNVSYCLARKLDFEDLAGVKLYLRYGADVNFVTQHGTRDTRLIHAIRRGRSAKIVELLLKHGADVHRKDLHGVTAYRLASRLGQTETAKLLLKFGAVDDLDEREKFLAACAAGDGKTARRMLKSDPELMKRLSSADHRLIADAADAGNIAAVRLMLDLGFNINAPGDWGGNALHHAAWMGHTKLVRLLLSRGADATSRQHFGGDALNTAIHGATNAGHKHGPEIVMLIAGAMRGLDFARYLEQARSEDSKDVVAVLEHLQNKRDAGITPPRRKQDWKPIMDAAFAGDFARVERLLNSGVNPNVPSTTNHHYRPLLRAIEHKKTMPKHIGHDQVVKVLLEHGADPKMRGTVANLNALQLAAMGEPRFVPLLRKHFEPLDIFNAAMLCDPERVGVLLTTDKSLAKARDANQFTPLHYCAASKLIDDDQLKVARTLLQAGADPNASYLFNNEWPISVLYHCAGQHNNPALTKLLLDAGADPCDGEAIYHAADEGHQECLDLFEQCVEPKKLAHEATMALPNQLHWGRTRGMPWLLAHGADPNYVSKHYGEAALHAAARNGANEKVVGALLKHGADPRVKNAAGKTAIQVAREAKKLRVVKQLEEAMRRRR